MFTYRSERDNIEGSSTGLFGGETSLRTRLEGATKTDKLANKAMIRSKPDYRWKKTDHKG